jgi:hypothetical protein
VEKEKINERIEEIRRLIPKCWLFVDHHHPSFKILTSINGINIREFSPADFIFRAGNGTKSEEWLDRFHALIDQVWLHEIGEFDSFSCIDCTTGCLTPVEAK